MKSFVIYTALFMGILFVTVAAFAWFDVLQHGEFFSNPLVKTAAGWSMTGLMLLAVGIRGLRQRKRINAQKRVVETR